MSDWDEVPSSLDVNPVGAGILDRLTSSASRRSRREESMRRCDDAAKKATSASEQRAANKPSMPSRWDRAQDPTIDQRARRVSQERRRRLEGESGCAVQS